MSEPGGKLTYADYAALPDDGKRYQLVEGELVVTPAPTPWHQRLQLKLAAKLDAFVEQAGLGVVLVSPLDVVLEERTVVQPDVVFISRQRAAIVTKSNVRGAPDACVEILSPGTERLDRVRKFNLYARFGILHYWIVDPESRTIEEFALEGAVYRSRGVTTCDDAFRPAAFPGFEFSMASAELPGRGLSR